MSDGTVILYGSSDDLIEIEGSVPGCDEYTADSDDSGCFVLTGPEGAVRLRVTYANEGVWEITVGQVSEDQPMLPVSVEGSGYSARATVRGVSLVVREQRD